MTEMTSGDDYVKVLTTGQELPDSFERGDSPKGPWVRIEKTDLDRRFHRTVTAMWDGQAVNITGTGVGVAHIHFNGSTRWAEQHGLTGSQYEAWGGSVALEELSDITVTEKDPR